MKPVFNFKIYERLIPWSYKRRIQKRVDKERKQLKDDIIAIDSGGPKKIEAILKETSRPPEECLPS